MSKKLHSYNFLVSFNNDIVSSSPLSIAISTTWIDISNDPCWFSWSFVCFQDILEPLQLTTWIIRLLHKPKVMIKTCLSIQRNQTKLTLNKRFGWLSWCCIIILLSINYIFMFVISEFCKFINISLIKRGESH